MTRPRLARLLATLATGAVTLVLTPVGTAQAAPAAQTNAPLSVTITSLSPSTIPERGPVTLAGEVTNNSDGTWTGLKAYLLTSATPITSREELARAAETDPATQIGSRLVAEGLYADLADLAPGSTTSYVLSVPRSRLRLSGDQGVYWVGVHVLGTDDAGRDGVADGRARSFMPLVGDAADKRPTAMSLVVPVKERVERERNGTLTNPDAWQERLRPEGRLGRLLQFSGTSSDVPLTWVVDPAVLDAARSVANDNPPRNIGPTVDPAEQPGSESPSPPDGASPDPDAGSTAPDTAPETADLSEPALAARRWLDLFARQAQQHLVRTVPYGDADVSALIRYDAKGMYEAAAATSTTTMNGFDIDSAPVIAPPTGRLSNAALREIDADASVLLADHAAPRADGSYVEASESDGHGVVLLESPAATGGPGPSPRTSALSVRQRLLADAALHALSGQREDPIVVATPQRWDPGTDWRSASFFDGLDVGWLDMVDLEEARERAARQPRTRYDGLLAYGRAGRRAELPPANVRATEGLAETGAAFAQMLTLNDRVDQVLLKSALLASSTFAHAAPRRAADRALDTATDVRFLMEKVRIDGPSFVTMSSDQGTFAVTLVNDLDQPVTVGIEAETLSDDLSISTPAAIDLGAGQRSTVRLRVEAADIGVRSVTLHTTTAEGDRLGGMTELSVRNSQVGAVIWAIMGAGAAILFVASGLRITRRVRGRTSGAPVGNEST